MSGEIDNGPKNAAQEEQVHNRPAKALAAAPSVAPAVGDSAAAPAVAAMAATSATAPAPAAPPVVPVKIPPWLKPPPNKKSYMPMFSAPEAYGKRADPKYAQMRKDEEDRVAKAKAKTERARAARRRKKKGGDEATSAVKTEDDGEQWKLMFLVALGIFTALAEALDLDVLLGILFMPFMSAMKWLAIEFNNVNLDPQVWMDMFGTAYNDMCQHNPSGFVAADFTVWIVLVIYVLFQADINKLWAERNLRNQGYEDLDGDSLTDQDDDEQLENVFNEIDENASGGLTRDEVEGAIRRTFGELEPGIVDEMMAKADTDHDGDITLVEFKIVMRAGPKELGNIDQIRKGMTDVNTMALMLRNAREELEEVELMARLRGEGAEPEIKRELAARRARLDKQIETLNGFLAAVETTAVEEVDLETAAKAAEEAEAAKAREGGCSELTKTFVTILKNTISGVLTIYLYFMDLISDYQVTVLYYHTGAMRFAFVSACLLFGQFLVVWLRVLPYLQVTYGSQSTFYQLFLFLGMPLGCFFFDFLMFLGPFGLLPIAPLPEAMRLFVPAYAATRMIAEVLVEALPQWIMQAIIFVIVSNHVREGTASESDMRLYEYNNGSFLTLMPKSILLSSATMLKTWYDLVQEAREAGISVAKKGVQLWNVGAGLPLDAIKSGSITKWGCSYEVSDQEVVSLVDALGKNDSLERLDLSLAGFEWMPPIKREERSALSTLLEAMNGDEKALESLEVLVISRMTKWEIPVGALRSGPEKALRAIGEVPFLVKGGPEREEMHAMFELLCKNRAQDPGESGLELSYAAVTKIFNETQKTGVTVKVKREAWQKSVAQLIAKGMTRRAHFNVVVGAEVLRNVGFKARELLDLGFSAEELKAGFFEARELREAGFSPAQLKALGYMPKDMWEADIPAVEMRNVGYIARELREGGYTAQQMKNSQAYSLDELKEGQYKALDLGEAGYLIPALRAAKFTALDLRKALIFSVQMMRDAGYTAPEMKKAGYDATRIFDAGYSAAEASGAGYSLAQMFTAGFAAGDLRTAGHTAVPMREAGYELMALKAAGFQAHELMDAGYTAQEIKEAGTSLVQLKAANTPMYSLKDIGYTAQRLKQQGYTSAELALGARGRIDIRTLVVGEDTGGYTAKEMRGGAPPHITATELRKGKVFFRIEEWKDGAWPTKELREGGYTASEMKAQGYTSAELRKNAYSVQDLVEASFPIKELRAIGATAGELKGAGVDAKTLSEAGYSAKELLVAGFSAAELIACGYGVAALREAGFDAIQLRALGFSAAELKAYGYGAAALKEAGSVVKELKELGFSDEELEEAGFTRRAVDAVDGRPVQVLKDGDYVVAELREYGFVVADLRGIYTVKDIKDQGFSLQELRHGGMPEHAVLAVNGRTTKELRKAGYLSKILRKIGFVLYELAEGDYTATELKQARYGAEELRAVGFTAQALRVAGFSSKQLRVAGYSLNELQEGGYLWKDLVIFLRATHAELTKAGFKHLDPKHELFLLYRPTQEEMYVTKAKLKLRGCESLDSTDLGTLAVGTRVRVQKRSELSDGTKRALIALEAEPQPPLGWVSVIGKDGSDLLGVSILSSGEHIQERSHLFDIEGAAAKVAAATAAAGAWAATVWAAAGAWTEAMTAARGASVPWDRVGPLGVTQRATTLPPVTARAMQLAGITQRGQSTQRGASATQRSKDSHLSTPRSSTVAPGALASRLGVASLPTRGGRAGAKSPASTRLAELGGASSRRQEQQSLQDEQIDERMDQRVDDLEAGRVANLHVLRVRATA